MSSKNQFKVFIVDDSGFCRNLYKQHLTNLGFKNIHMFDNAADCLKNMTEMPDFILFDYDMPVTNGIELLKNVKSTHPSVPMVMISAHQTIHVAVDAIRNGAADYIVKDDNELSSLQTVIEKIYSAISIAA